MCLIKNRKVYFFIFFLSYLKRSPIPNLIAQSDSLYSPEWESRKYTSCLCEFVLRYTLRRYFSLT